MADFNATAIANLVATPPVRRKANRQHGSLRFMESSYIAPASGSVPAIADRIVWGKLPTGSRVMGYLSQLQWGTGTASCTVNVGDNILPARYMAATACTTAGVAVCTAADLVQTGTADTVSGSAVLQNAKPPGAFAVGSRVASGTGYPTAGIILSVSGGAVELSGVATATGSAVACTFTGSSFETSDSTANAGNSFVSTTDDCTIISVVAGAQIANSQALVLRMAYITD